MWRSDAIALCVYAPAALQSVAPLELVRFPAPPAGLDATSFVLGRNPILIPPGMYRVSASRFAIMAASDEDLEFVAVRDEPWPQRLRSLLGPASDDELARFFPAKNAPSQECVGTIVSAAPRRSAARSVPFLVRSAEPVQITIYDAVGSCVARQTGEVALSLPSGLYRMHLEYGGAVHEELVEHVKHTALYRSGPPLRTPALVAHAATSHDYYREAAARFSNEPTAPPMGVSGQARLFVFVRREGAEIGPRRVPSEAITVRDANGRPLTALDEHTSHIDLDAGYLAFSCDVSPGTYRLRAARSRRDLAITVPTGRAAHVFIADRGALAMEDLRISLVPFGRRFDAASGTWSRMETAICALRSLRRELPSSIRELSPELLADDLCLAIAASHLAYRSGDVDTFQRVTRELAGCEEVPDIAILRRLAGGLAITPVGWRDTPPLFRASLLMVLADARFDSDEVPAAGGLARAACTAFHDSVWCTWSARPWDERWVEPTVEAFRRWEPRGDARSIARRFHVPPRVVEQTITGLDSTVPLVNGIPARPEEIRVPKYELHEVLGRGGQGVVFRAIRHDDHREVALKVVPLLGSTAQRLRAERELRLVQEVDHPHVLTAARHGGLEHDAGIWLEMELCRGSLLDVVMERDAPMTPEEACRSVLEALEGLAYLHEQGIVHRDLKPGNLLVRRDGRIAIGDLGIAKSLLDAGQLSATGTMGGTMRFAPREQLLDFKRVPYASDVWSMAATLYFLLTLELPREEYGDQSDLEAALENPIVPIRERRSELPEGLARCIDRALSLEIADRPRDGAEFRAALRALG